MSLHEESIESKKVFEGKLLHVFRDDVRLTGGDTTVREWIDHPGASAVVPLFEDGTTVLVRQFRYPPRRDFLEVPAGKLDEAGESPADVAHRELEEETGWRAGELIFLHSLYPCIGYSNEVIHFFLARKLERGRRNLQHGEAMDLVNLGFGEAVAMANRGEILDMKTVVALQLARRYVEDVEREREPAGKTFR